MKKYLPKEGELVTNLVLTALKAALAGEAYPKEVQGTYIPARTRTQCSGCSHRGLVYAMKNATRKNGGVVTGDIGCHDAGTFEPIEAAIHHLLHGLLHSYGLWH